jgi:hypothetical protein
LLMKVVRIKHGVFSRNAHGQEVVMNPEGLKWRSLGGSIDLTFYNFFKFSPVIVTPAALVEAESKILLQCR